MTGRYNQKVYSSLTKETMTVLFSQVLKMHPDLLDEHEKSWWFNPVNSCSTLMLAFLLLLHCPNITQLTPWSGYPESPQRLEFLSRAIRRLPKLRMVDYGTQNTKFSSIIWTDPGLNFLFQLPSVRHLRLQLTEELYLNAQSVIGDGICVCPHITNLDLHSSVLSEATIGKLILRLPNLKDLALGLLRETRPNSPDSVVAGSFIDCEALREALSPLKSSLERLTITVDFYSTKEWHRANGGPWSVGREGNPGILRHWGVKGALRDLRSFSKLAYLEIDQSLLVGMGHTTDLAIWEVVPQNLKTLKFRADFAACKDFQPSIGALVEKISELLDKNTEVATVILQKSKSQDVMRAVDTVDAFGRICVTKGIKFAIEEV
jgi:hypothetical protein